MASLNKTPLFDYHYEVGAKMIPVGSWTMPFQFGDGYKEEYLHAFEGTCITDFGCANILRMTGKDFDKISTILPPLEVGSTTYANWQQDGRFIDSILAVRMAEDDILAAFSPSCKSECQKNFVTAQDLSEIFGCLCVWGSECRETLSALNVDISNWQPNSMHKIEIDSVRCIAACVDIADELEGIFLFCDREKFDDVWIALFNTPDVWAAGFGAWNLVRLEQILVPYNCINSALPLCLGKWQNGKSPLAGESIIWTAKNVERKSQVIYSAQLPHTDGTFLLFSGEFEENAVLKCPENTENGGTMLDFHC